MARDNFTFINSQRVYQQAKRGKFFPGPTSTAAPAPTTGTPAEVTMVLDTAFGVTIKIN